MVNTICTWPASRSVIAGASPRYRRRMGHEAGADIGAGAATVLDDDLLIETLRHRLCDEPRDNVERAAGRDRNDETDRLARIGVCTREP